MSHDGRIATGDTIHDLDVAVLHGNYFQRGGGEVVADAIADTFDAPLYYGFGNDDAIPDDEIERIKVFEPNRVSKRLLRRFHQYRDLLFWQFGDYIDDLYDYDVIIQSGNEFGWWTPQDQQTVVKYVHSPPRGPYDLFWRHGDSVLHRVYAKKAKKEYQHTLSYVDEYLANSELVKNRCRKYWGVDATVCYPPVDVSKYGPEHAADDTADATYLTFSRLYRHKRTREIVEAFNDLPGRRLIVGGDGPQREPLEEIAGDTVDVRGYLSEAEKRRLLADADALLFNARNEDFGIVPVEAFASGTPVIGINDGFTAAQIADGVNGVVYDDPSARGVRAAVERFERDGVAASSEELQAYADVFSRERFERELRDAVRRACEKNEIGSPAAAFDWQTERRDAEPLKTDGGE